MKLTLIAIGSRGDVQLYLPPENRPQAKLDIPLPASTESDLCNPDKHQLRTNILAMRADGMSYRQIARAVGLHWTRVGQLVKRAVL